jgi:hypothetical protein
MGVSGKIIGVNAVACCAVCALSDTAVPEAVAAAESVIMPVPTRVPALMAVMVVPAGMPGPVTNWPTPRAAVTVTEVTELLEVAVVPVKGVIVLTSTTLTMVGADVEGR